MLACSCRSDSQDSQETQYTVYPAGQGPNRCWLVFIERHPIFLPLSGGMAPITPLTAGTTVAVLSVVLLLMRGAVGQGPPPFVLCLNAATSEHTCVPDCGACVAEFLPTPRTCGQLCAQYIDPNSPTGESYKSEHGPRCLDWCKVINPGENPVPFFCQNFCKSAPWEGPWDEAVFYTQNFLSWYGLWQRISEQCNFGFDTAFQADDFVVVQNIFHFCQMGVCPIIVQKIVTIGWLCVHNFSGWQLVDKSYVFWL